MVSLLRTTRLRTLYVTDNIIHLQLLQLIRSPFLGSLTIRPVFHDNSASSDPQMSRWTSVSNVAVICTSACSISTYIWSIPVFFFHLLMPLLLSWLLRHLVDPYICQVILVWWLPPSQDHLCSALAQSVPSNISVYPRLLRSHSLVGLSHACLLYGSLSLLVILLVCTESSYLVLKLLPALPLRFSRCISSCPPWSSL